MAKPVGAATRRGRQAASTTAGAMTMRTAGTSVRIARLNILSRASHCDAKLREDAGHDRVAEDDPYAPAPDSGWCCIDRSLMSRERGLSALASALVLGVLVAEACLLVAHVVNHATVQNRIVDFDEESNLPTWLSSSQFLLAAVAAFVGVAWSERRSAQIAWASVAIFALVMSIDEVAVLHEEVGTRLGDKTTLSVVQPAAALVALGLLLGAASVVARSAARALGRAATALVVSQASATFAGLYGTGDALFALETVEDFTEVLTGTFLFVAALHGCGLGIQWRPRPLIADLAAWFGERTREEADRPTG